ncbi:hypothetical protein GCM10010517_46990 [Streptosporangium fragile]|uniref:Uncharacterized protein n=1 Tax=Streptosporangium fragile TaxID=46186 RepID=A0ABN3W1Z9_9ACTN
MTRSAVAFALFCLLLPFCAGCDRQSASPLDGVEGVQVVAELRTVPGHWERDELEALRPPDLVVYSDGLVVREARQSTRLSPAETSELVGRLAGELPGKVENPPEVATTSDLSTLHIGVHVAGEGMRRLSVYGYGHGARTVPEKYPKGLHDAYARLTGIATGTPYTSDRVRVMTVALPDSAAEDVPDRIGDWPEGAPRLDPAPGSGGTQTDDLSGEEARAAAAHLPGFGGNPNRTSSLLAHPTRGNLIVGWRYLLPAESPA